MLIHVHAQADLNLHLAHVIESTFPDIAANNILQIVQLLMSS